MYEIEKGVPMPPSKTLYPFAQMEIGDSFFVPNKTTSSFSGTIANRRPKKFKSSAVMEKGVKGVRVWRIE